MFGPIRLQLTSKNDFGAGRETQRTNRSSSVRGSRDVGTGLAKRRRRGGMARGLVILPERSSEPRHER